MKWNQPSDEQVHTLLCRSMCYVPVVKSCSVQCKACYLPVGCAVPSPVHVGCVIDDRCSLLWHRLLCFPVCHCYGNS